jgi:orotidine-5'-phosphate decarboxylase
VIGATVDWTDAGLAAFTPFAPILAPGFGSQGATPADLRHRFGSMSATVVASESRSILSAGPAGLSAAIDARVAEYREADRG